MACAKIVELTESNICQFCDNALGKYSCPRCYKLYCNLACYQSEGHIDCSESFYKDCVLEDTSLGDADEASKAKMLEILNHLQKSDESFNDTLEALSEARNLEEDLDSDDEGYLDLGERLAGIDLNDTENIWKKLTSDERQDFEAFLSSPDVSKLINKWEPWWTYRNTKPIQEAESQTYAENCPKIMSNIAAFATLSNKEPADCVTYNLINVLASYVFVLRYFNGDLDFPEEAATCLVSLSLCLRTNLNFSNFETAVESVRQECINTDWIVVDFENLQAIKEDLDAILKGPELSNRKFYILCALSDLHNLLNLALSQNKKTKGKDSFAQRFPESQFPSVNFVSKDKLKVVRKKIEYFLSFTKDHFQF